MSSYRSRGFLMAVLAAWSLSALATQPNNNGNDSNASADADATAVAAANANAVGLGLGVGIAGAEGGDATAFGGKSESNSAAFGGHAGADADAAVIGSGNSHSSNTNLIGVTDIDSQGQEQGQGQLQGQGQGQSLDNAVETDVVTDASSSNELTNGQGQSQKAASNQGQSLNYEDSSKFLSLALPGATADNGSTAACLESRRGWIFSGFGASGRTRTNEECDEDRTDRREFEQCSYVAQAYASFGAPANVVLGLLAKCAGLEDAPTVPTNEVESTMDSSDFVTREEMSTTIDRAFQASQSK